MHSRWGGLICYNVRTITKVAAMQRQALQWRRQGVRIGFVPTMGYLHEGHMSLVRRARKEVGRKGRVVVSIYVNPTQFNEPADFQNYPRLLEADLALLESAGAEMVFAPIDDEMYPLGEPQAIVDVPSLTFQLEGAHRPGHFRGVC